MRFEPPDDEGLPEHDLVVGVKAVCRRDVAEAELPDAVDIHRLDVLRLLTKGAQMLDRQLQFVLGRIVVVRLLLEESAQVERHLQVVV